MIAIASFLFLGMSYGFSVAAQHEAAALHDLSFLFPVARKWHNSQNRLDLSMPFSFADLHSCRAEIINFMSNISAGSF